MKLRLCLFLAATSFCFACVVCVHAARRPKFGGTLRVEIGATVNSLDPTLPPANPEESAARDQIGALLYDRRNPDGTFAGVAGSGAFRIAEWEPGKHATLTANENYREGRPFVDTVEIQMGRSARDRLLDLELDKADFAEIPPEEARHASERGVRVSVSQPDELVALAFLPGRPIVEDARARQALALSIDRSAIVNFILQKTGEPAGGLLPQSSSGTAFLFPTAPDPAAARSLWSQIAASPRIALGYDANDSLERAIAERIAVNAREAGIAVEPRASVASGSATDDARLVRVVIPSPHPGSAIAHFIAVLAPLAGLEGEPLPASPSPQQVYDRERAIVASYRVVPLVWLPQVYGLGARVRDWKVPAAGEGWPFADVWLGDAQ
jgi:Bacterial extracellular solute-binding proteins, family 5 Middle